MLKTKSNRLPPVYRIAIIGVGPKGLYGFERLAAQLKSYPVSGPVEIHLFNRTAHFGSGDIYRTDQPNYLLINFCIGNINMWIDEAPPPVAPCPLPLTAWLQQKHDPPLPVDDLDYAPRALVGRYLEAGLQAIADHLPAHVGLRYVVGQVEDLQPSDVGYKIKYREPNGQLVETDATYQQVLLATGHPPPPKPVGDDTYTNFCRRHPKCGYIPFVYPVSTKLQGVPAHSMVAMKGIGLTFVDAALALTEGRGGCFERNQHNELVYRPSNTEPACIYPFSRSGLPMLPRGPAFGSSQTRLHIFTKEAVATLYQNAPTGQLDFSDQLWPLLQQEMVVAYYTVLFRRAGWTLEIADKPSPEQRIQHATEQIENFHKEHPDQKRFLPDLFLDPLKDTCTAAPENHHRFIVGYLQKAIEHARQGEVESPWMAVVAVWREATPIFGDLFRFGGLKPASHRLFAERFNGSLSRVTFGPPIESMEKIVALAKAGFVNFGLSRSATVEPQPDAESFCLQSHYTGAKQNVSYVIDARIPKVSLTNNSTDLYRNLLERRLIRSFENVSNSDHDLYRPGCLDLSLDGCVIDADGNSNKSITVTGTPTEGVTFDNDSLSRTRNNFVSRWAARVRNEIEEYYR